jgi:hypothetical protein
VTDAGSRPDLGAETVQQCPTGSAKWIFQPVCHCLVGFARRGDPAGLFSLPEDPKSGILLPRGAVPGFGVLFRALVAPDDTPKDRPPGMPGS